uniref:Short-chain dehydrogenase/reductase 3 n=1 Tax=Caligus clemensi TaxID=344056 RepID=C1C2E0_CALCM|nr:Epidermal retinal dehydrogenase 2 [Caligus clemensi]
MMMKQTKPWSPSNTSTLREILFLIYHVLRGFVMSFVQMIFPRKLKNLYGEVALITGAGGGLGRELALQLSDLGVKVVVVDINEKAAEETVKMIRSKGADKEDCLSYQCDVSNPKEVSYLLDRISKETKLTMLVNNAGIAYTKPFMKHSLEEIESLFKVNVLSHMYLLKEILPTFIEADKGHVVSIGSIAGSIGTPNLVPYCSTKFAIRGLTDSLLLELREHYPKSSVKMTTAHPYSFKSDLIPKPKNRFENMFPIYTPKEVARRVIEAVRRDETVVMMPPLAGIASNFQSIVPAPVKYALLDFLGCGVEETQ